MPVTRGLFHFFDVIALVTLVTTDGKEFNVWAHLSAEHVTSLPPDQVTYGQVIAGSPQVVCSVGFMWNDTTAPKPKNERILVGYPLSVGQRRWEQALNWRVDCPVDRAPSDRVSVLREEAIAMIKAVLAPSFGCREDEVAVALQTNDARPHFLYFNPDSP